MTANNNLIFNSAFSAFLQAAFFGRSQTGIFPVNFEPGSANFYAEAVGAAAAFATALDSRIPNDTTLMLSADTTGAAQIPTTGPIVATQQAVTSLIQGMTIALFAGRFPSGIVNAPGNPFLTPEFYAQEADLILTAYTAAVAALGPTGTNTLL